MGLKKMVQMDWLFTRKECRGARIELVSAPSSDRPKAELVLIPFKLHSFLCLFLGPMTVKLRHTLLETVD